MVNRTANAHVDYLFHANARAQRKLVDGCLSMNFQAPISMESTDSTSSRRGNK